MKSLIFLALTLCSFGNTCGNFTVDAVVHNSFRVRWTNDDSAGSTQVQVQYGTTSAYGSIAGDSLPQNIPYAGGTGVHVYTVPGLLANTTYHFAAQSMGNTSGTYCAAVDQTVTTAAAVTHPVYPIPPVTYTLSAPTPTGVVYLVSPLTCTSVYPSGFTNTLYGGSSCANAASLQSAISSSFGGAYQATYGDVIILQAGSVQQYSAASLGATLTLAQAADAVKLISLNGSGVWTCSPNCGSLTTGQQVILGFGYDTLNFGEPNTNLPVPFIPGYPYWVTVSGSTFTASLTNGGSTVVPLTGSFSTIPSACFVIADANGNVPVPVNGPIQIRTSALDTQLPPFGVLFDPITFPAYAALTAQIQDATPGYSTTQALGLGYGCMAHDYWFGPGIEFNYAPVGTIGEYDGQAYNTAMFTTPSNFRITFDRFWAHGGDYPERDYKLGGDLDGHFISIVSGTFSGLNFWTPWWSSEPILPSSSTVITIPSADTQGNPGNIYFGNGSTDYLPFSGTLTLTSGSTAGQAVFEATRSGFFLTLPTGDTATCAIVGQTCTVANAGSPAYATSGGFYSRVPIASLTISGGSWIAGGPCGSVVCENPPTSASTQNQGQEGAVAFSITNGPGPYLIDNNQFLNDPGITFYLTGQQSGFVSDFIAACTNAGQPACSFLPQPPGDIVFSRNKLLIDKAHLARSDNALSNGRFYSMRQHWEIKEGARTRNIGNIFQGAFCANFSGRGYDMAFSSIGGLFFANGDHEVGWNTFDSQCQAFQEFSNEHGSGGWPNSTDPTTADSQQLQQRIWWHDNIITNVDRYGQATPNSFYGVPGDNGQHHSIQQGVSDLTMEHNFFGCPKGGGPDFAAFVYNITEGLAIRNNIICYSNDDAKSGAWVSGFASGTNPNPSSSTGSGAVTGINPVNLNWNNNLMFGGWTNSATLTEMSTSDITTPTTGQQALWSGLVSTAFFPSGNTIAARAAQIGFTKYANSGGNYNLLYDSSFQSGGANRGSDGRQVGPNYDAVCVHQGCVSGARVISIGSTTATVTWYAPDATPCLVDYGTDPTFTTFTPHVSPTVNGRSQSLAVTGLSANTAYSARINCAVQQPVVSWTTL